MNRTVKFNLLAIFLISALIFSSCNASKTVKGGAIGTASGAAIGGALGSRHDNTVMGAIIGAAIGGTTGALIGRHMEKQTEELQKDLEGATVEQYEEGILIVFDDGAMFAVNSDELSAKAKQNLDEMSEILKKYQDTDILIEGHTDSTGDEDYNKDLSLRRAKSVDVYLISKGVDSARLTYKGYGETQPIATNDTEEGRAQNRRVDVAITANKQMVKAAKRGELE